MKQKKVLYVEKPSLVGGSVTGLYQLVRGLDTSRYEPIVLFYGPNPYRERFREIGVRVLTLSEAVPTTAAAAPRRRDIAASLDRYSQGLGTAYRMTKQAYTITSKHRPLAKQVHRLIKEHQVDLVHHNNSLPVSLATIMAARMAGVPQVSHVRDLQPFSAIDRYLGRSVDAFVLMSTAIQRLYHELGTPSGKGRVIYDAFDTTALWKPRDIQTASYGHGAKTPTKSQAFDGQMPYSALRAELGIGEHDRVISNVGRLDWWKGQDYFVQAVAELVRGGSKAGDSIQHQNGSIKALLIGAPDNRAVSQAYYQNLQTMVQDLGMSRHVIFTGYRTDVPDLLALSDVVVHSSSEPEPFGRVVVEAMLAGKPAIATAAGGPLDIIEDQVTGLLVPIKDSAAMARALVQLLENQTEARAMGQRARESAQRRFSIKQHLTAIHGLYEEIIQEHNEAK